MVRAVQNTYLPKIGNNETVKKDIQQDNVFETAYQAAIQLIEETNQAELEADRKSVELAMGKTNNIEDVLIAQEKANLLLQFTIQVRNKAIESYKEIMRMQL